MCTGTIRTNARVVAFIGLRAIGSSVALCGRIISCGSRPAKDCGGWTRGTDPSSWVTNDPWLKVEGLPDQNVTALAAGGDGDVFVGVGVPTWGEGADIKGGVVRIDATGHIHSLDQAGAPPFAPDRMLWQQGMLWVKSHAGLSRFDCKISEWKRLYAGRSMFIGSGTDRILIVEAARKIKTAYWILADAAGANSDLNQIITAPDLLIGFAVETPDAFWFGGRAIGVTAGREIQCVDKRTGRMMTLDEGVGLPFAMVYDALWFQDRLWIGTNKGLLAIEDVRFPTTAPTTKPH